ncbi:hypothetical protein BGZ98_005300, partial [Dissophora globulifera]
MAKKKATTRKTKSLAPPYQPRSNSAQGHNSSKAPSTASSPSPQPIDHAHAGRRKSQPRRSPSQNDTSKGIVFSFRIQNDSALSMAVNIRSYDQQFGPPEETEPTLKTLADSDRISEADASALSHSDSSSSESSSSPNSSNSSSRSSFSGPSSSSPSELRATGHRWSSDLSSYRNSNVYDHSRNLLVLHTRKPSAAAAPTTAAGMATTDSSSSGFHPYRSKRSSLAGSVSSTLSSFHSTPALMHSASSSSASSITSSPSSSPSSPTTPSSPTVSANLSKGDMCLVDPLPLPLLLDAIGAQPTRILN